MLPHLKDLNVSYNHLVEIDNLAKCSKIHTLFLDHNKFRRIEGIRGLRKLEMLSMVGNKITDITPGDSTEPMINLRHLRLNNNRIQCIEASHCYPNLEVLELSNNPLNVVFPEAFVPLKQLDTLILDNVRFKYPQVDMVFLKKIQNRISKLSLNGAFYKQNLERIDSLNFLEMERVEHLCLRGNGILNIQNIDTIFPNVVVLDLADNKIFSVDAVEELHKLSALAEVTMKNNPICVHKHLNDMIKDVVPEIEVVNDHAITEAGHKYKMELQSLRKQIESLGMQPEMEDSAASEDLETDGKVNSKALALKKMAIDNIFGQARKDQDESDKMLRDFEKSFGLRFKPMNEYADPHDEALHDPLQDLEIFKEVTEHTFKDLRNKHRKVVDELRTTEYGMFQKINDEKLPNRPDQAGGVAYSKMEEEVAEIKKKIAQAAGAKNFLEDDLPAALEKRTLGFRDFYNAMSDSDDDRGEGEAEGSYDSEAESDGSLDDDRKRRRKAALNKRELYAAQLKKTLGTKEGKGAANESTYKTMPSGKVEDTAGGRPSSSTRRSRDFIIKGKSPSLSTSGSQSQMNPQNAKQHKEQLKLLSGLGAKAHTLAK